MPMEIQEHKEVVLICLFAVGDEKFKLWNLNENMFVRVNELSVEIFARQSRPIVSKHHAIRVQHGNNFKH